MKLPVAMMALFASVIVAGCSTPATTEEVVDPTSGESTYDDSFQPVDPDTLRAEDGSYRFSFSNGSRCIIGGGLSESPIVCDLDLAEPMPTRSGGESRGIELAEGMFVPSELLADAAAREEFARLTADAVPLGFQSELQVDGFFIMQETVDELAFGHESGAGFFMAERQPTLWWIPVPEWVPAPSFPLPPEEAEQLRRDNPEVFG